MNAAHMNPNPSNAQEALSALVDGELEAAGLAKLLTSVHAEPQALGDWHAYQVIGDVLRGSTGVVCAQRPADFLAGVRERLQAEDGHRPSLAPQGRVLGSLDESVSEQAANDAVFRWKMAAGFASLAAVVAVSWNLMGGAVPGGVATPGPQLASSTPAAPVTAAPAQPQAVAAVVSPSRPTEVVVNTGQGPLIRDARLEELLAEHRQHGGMSALQMPTGFIRGATYDTSAR